MRECGSKERPIQNACERRWKDWSDDRGTDRNADLDCRRSNGSATRIHWAERTGADGSERKSVLRPCVCFSRPKWRSDQNVVVGWRRSVPVCEATGERPLYLAESGERHGSSDASTAVDAVGRHRLAPPDADTHTR